uniref:iron-sulfur cluster assembly scaffold protein IscU-like isoform X2 n=1 Tax=Oncorhynchus gorbuscha TaxID=8017 RepID=UPI001EAF1B92|nr:iron-sulfur cluster assembly scaffold protein IscU-like isoform X2 [Oncorhynchus gorbuscha]
MAGLVAAKKCITPLVVIKRLSSPEYKAQAAYHKKVVDHYENPRNVGSLDKTSKNVGTGLVGAPACGDVMKLQIEVDDCGKIVDARFKTFGCGSAIASSSLVTEWVKGKSCWLRMPSKLPSMTTVSNNRMARLRWSTPATEGFANV